MGAGEKCLGSPDTTSLAGGGESGKLVGDKAGNLEQIEGP